MPANDRPIPINVQIDPRRGHNKVGAVIEFCDGASEFEVKRAQAFLDRLAERGIIKPTIARSFDSSWGNPVWYIP